MLQHITTMRSSTYYLSFPDLGVTKRWKRNRNGKNFSDWLNFLFKILYSYINKNTLYSIKASEDIFTTVEIVLSFGGLVKNKKKALFLSNPNNHRWRYITFPTVTSSS